MKISVFIFLFIDISIAIHLNCVFSKTGWDDVLFGSAFACKTKNLNISSPQVITKVFPEKSRDNVNAFLVLDQNCEYFPSGIDQFFKNIEGIAVQKSNLRKISKNDLKGFGNLRSISLFGNRLRVIENELFRYNPRLELVSLFANQIQHIFPSAFDNLANLRILYLNSNPCISKDALEKPKIEELKCEIVTKCKVTDEMREFAAMETEKLKFEDEFLKISSNFDALNKNFAALKRDLNRCQDGYERFKNHIDENSTEDCVISINELKKCESEKSDLSALIQELEIVEIKCKLFAEVHTCEAYDMKIFSPKFTVINVKTKFPSQTELLIQDQQVLFLPLNLTNFFKGLIKFTVTRSQLVEINHDAFSGFENLQEINFSFNEIQEIQNFQELRKLKKLDLSRNKIEIIGNSAFSLLQNLEEIKLNDNLIVKIMGRTFAANGRLRIVYLQNNKISQVASNFADFLPKIDILDLSNNVCIDAKYPDKSLEVIIDKWNENCNVDIEFKCKYEHKVNYICHADSLEIDSKNVKIIGVVGEHKVNFTDRDVTQLDIVDQKVEFLPREIGKFFPNVNKLVIKNSGLQEIGDESFENLNLVEVSLSNNSLKEFNTFAFTDSKLLQILDLSQNQIEEITEDAFVNFTAIKSLNFHRNRLTTLENSMIPSPNIIEKMDFSQNQLTTIDPEIIKNLKKIKLIDLTGNTCIDTKYDQNFNNVKKLMEIFGEIHFKCIN